jgi:purine nucleosidase
VHGEDGLGDYHERPPTTHHVEAEHAALALIRLANTYPGELTLVALAPLTNIALATRLDPSFPSKIKSFVFMGGTIRAQGNTDNIAAEWNIYCDPEAAYIVLDTFAQARMVSWETTLDHPLPIASYRELANSGTPSARFFERINRIFVDKVSSFGLDYLLADALAMAVALEPSLITASLTRHVAIELHGTYTRGQTVIDHMGKLGRPASVEIVTAVDMTRMEQMLREMLQ